MIPGMNEEATVLYNCTRQVRTLDLGPALGVLTLVALERRAVEKRVLAADSVQAALRAGTLRLLPGPALDLAPQEVHEASEPADDPPARGRRRKGT